MRFVVACALLSSACVVDELTAPHTTPGGEVHAALAGGADHVCSALGDGAADPFTISGFSPFLTFGLVGSTDGAGASVHGDVAALVAPATLAIDVPLVAGSASHLEIHLDGSGCVATSGVVHLRVDAQGLLQGDFTGSGTVSGSAAPCQFFGGILNVPLAH